MASSEEIAWAAGLFEGEGSFNSPAQGVSLRMSLGMTDEDVVRRFYAIVGTGNVYEIQQVGRKTVWQWCVSRQEDVDVTAELLLPHLGARRSARYAELKHLRDAAIAARGTERHGTRSRYTNRRCRCGACREANAAYIARLKADAHLNGGGATAPEGAVAGPPV